jgi:hypothetical protein
MGRSRREPLPIAAFYREEVMLIHTHLAVYLKQGA